MILYDLSNFSIKSQRIKTKFKGRIEHMVGSGEELRCARSLKMNKNGESERRRDIVREKKPSQTRPSGYIRVVESARGE